MSDEAEIQKWIEYAEHPTEIKRPLLNNGLLVGTINNILRHNNKPLIKLSDIHDSSVGEVKTSTENIKSVLKKIKIPKITEIEDVHEKLDEVNTQLSEFKHGKLNEEFKNLVFELENFIGNSFPRIAIEYSREEIKHILNIKFIFREVTTVYTLKTENFNSLITTFFSNDTIKNLIIKMLNTNEFFEFNYTDYYEEFKHTLFVYVNKEERIIIGEFNNKIHISDAQVDIENSIREKKLKYINNKIFLIALYELMLMRQLRELGYTLKGLPTIQEGPICTFWMFFRMVFHDLTREKLIEKLKEAALKLKFPDAATEILEAIIVVMIKEMLHNPEIKQQKKIADSITGFGLNKIK